MFLSGLDPSELKEINKEKPFNDLWPPIYLGPGYHYPTLRVTWYHWLKRGWLNNSPYRDLKIWDYNPRTIEARKKKRRTSQINARRTYRKTDSDLQQQKRFRQLRARRTRKSNLEVQDQEQG